MRRAECFLSLLLRRTALMRRVTRRSALFALKSMRRVTRWRGWCVGASSMRYVFPFILRDLNKTCTDSSDRNALKTGGARKAEERVQRTNCMSRTTQHPSQQGSRQHISAGDFVQSFRFTALHSFGTELNMGTNGVLGFLGSGIYPSPFIHSLYHH
jgi:hypothetical protein